MRYASCLVIGLSVILAVSCASRRPHPGPVPGTNSSDRGIGNIDVLSDTMGVNFGPYLSRVLHDVRQSWYNLIPEVARAPVMKKGNVTIEFTILKDGRLADLKLTESSGDVAMDRAAFDSITQSNPWPPLPKEFTGKYLALRFHFLYNPGVGWFRPGALEVRGGQAHLAAV